jgi:hypothetical protein
MGLPALGVGVSSGSLTCKRLRRGEFESRQELVDKMLAFIDHYGTTATPFKWVYDAKTKAA